MSKHTPGPWEVRPEIMWHDGSHVAGRTPKVMKEGRQIASITRSLDAKIKDGRCEEAEANARLIAAAPRLLEALRKLVERIDTNGGIGEYKGGPPFVMAEARAAIKEATGES